MNTGNCPNEARAFSSLEKNIKAAHCPLRARVLYLFLETTILLLSSLKTKSLSDDLNQCTDAL